MGKVITFGEIMLRLGTPEHQRFSQATNFNASYGGSEANVAISLANYGVSVDFVSRIPSNDIGDAAIKELRKHGVNTSKILRGGERLGIYFLEKGAVNRSSKVVYDRAYSSISKVEKGMIDWNKVFDGASWFHWTGITPAISQTAANVCFEAIQAANELGLTVSTDLNYRKNLWKYGKTVNEVMPKLVAGCDIFIGNETDAEMALGIKTIDNQSNEESFRSVAQEIMKQFPKIKQVVKTIRGTNNASHNTLSGMLYDGKTLYKATDYNITHIVDRVGGGDAFVGGLIYGLLNYKDNYQKGLDFALAASCLKHTVQGDFNLVTIAEVEKLMQGDQTGKVDR